MKSLIIFLLLCVNFAALFSQESVETISVTIIENDSVRITWKPFIDLPKINNYEIREFDLSVLQTFPNSGIQVAPTKTSHTFKPKISNVNAGPVQFLIEAVKILNPDDHFGGYKNISRTMYCFVEKYDSCNSEIILKWNQYGGWGTKWPLYLGNVKQYQVYDAITQQPIGKPTADTDTTYTVKNVVPNTTNKFYILATHADNETITSRSNVVTDNTPTPPIPAYILAETANYNNANQVDLIFQIDPTTPQRTYVLTRSANPNGPFTEVTRFTNIDNTPITKDPSPLSVTGYYRLEAQSHCGEALKVSNLATAIVPKGIYAEQNNVIITWDNYIKWPDGVATYEVYRSYDGVNFEKTTSVFDPKFSENIIHLMNNILGNKIYYRIIASASGDNDYKAISKTISVPLDLQVYLPNAFTPDGNGQNDNYKPSIVPDPTSYKMIIYDRYGFKVFETSILSKGWNGKLANNKAAPEGAYVFYITYTNDSGVKFEKKGNFSLIYP